MGVGHYVRLLVEEVLNPEKEAAVTLLQLMVDVIVVDRRLKFKLATAIVVQVKTPYLDFTKKGQLLFCISTVCLFVLLTPSKQIMNLRLINET